MVAHGTLSALGVLFFSFKSLMKVALYKSQIGGFIFV